MGTTNWIQPGTLGVRLIDQNSRMVVFFDVVLPDNKILQPSTNGVINEDDHNAYYAGFVIKKITDSPSGNHTLSYAAVFDVNPGTIDEDKDKGGTKVEDEDDMVEESQLITIGAGPELSNTLSC